MIGNNGENWFESQTQQDKEWLVNMLPMGSTYCLRLRDDKPDRPANNISGCVDLSPYLESNGIQLSVVYCASMDQPVADTMNRLATLAQGGVNVIAVEFGNEYYSSDQANFDFNAYKAKFQPLYNAIKTQYLSLPCTIFLAPRPLESGVAGGRRDHSTFNNAAIAYINTLPSEDGVSIHIYFNARDCPVMADLPVARVFDPKVDYPDLTTFYTTLSTQTSLENLWGKTLSYLSTKLPGRKAYITEFGYEGSWFKNTIGYSLGMWKVWQTYGNSPQIAAMLEHNGISKSSPGMIFPANARDLNPSGYTNLRRVGYFTQEMFRQCGNVQAMPAQVSKTGRYYFTNPGLSVPLQAAAGYVITAAGFEYLGGGKLYDSSGTVEWMGKDSVPTYKIDSISALSLPGSMIPMCSFGYVDIIVTTIPSPPSPPPTDDPCLKCQSFWYRLFHLNQCKNC